MEVLQRRELWVDLSEVELPVGQSVSHLFDEFVGGLGILGKVSVFGGRTLASWEGEVEVLEWFSGGGVWEGVSVDWQFRLVDQGGRFGGFLGVSDE